MSLFARLLQAVRSWRRRRGGPKTVRYAGIAMEQLDHRQLLSVNFTGNVPIDFPATQSPGVVVLPDNPSVVHPTLGPTLAPNFSLFLSVALENARILFLMSPLFGFKTEHR